MSLLLGAIADDFTGATDLANTLVKQGMRVTQVIGVPDETTDVGDAEAVIVALKSRTAPVDDAISMSLNAIRWLKTRQTRQFFFKYCSTFDSTANGNIGPVADALMDELDSDFAFICPAFPTNGRTIFQGHLFVNEDLLSESPMKDHPLTPMRDSSLLRLIDAQSNQCCGLIPWQQVRLGSEEIAKCVEVLKSQGFHYGVVDAITDDDLVAIAKAANNHRLVTGGSGIAIGLPANFRDSGELQSNRSAPVPGARERQLVLAGSCSAATRKQVEAAQANWPHRKIDVAAIVAGKDVVAELTQWAITQDNNTPVLIYASADPTEVADIQQRYGVETAGAMIEEVMGKLAQKLVAQGFNRLIVAGGETSGAVVSTLNIRQLQIGPEIDPGVPWTETSGDINIALALKSGNFGGVDFFNKAFQMLT